MASRRPRRDNDAIEAHLAPLPLVDGPDPAPDLVLTRERLLDGSLLRQFAESNPALRMLTDAERDASLHETLAARPKGTPVWLFAYGSLIWNPMVRFAERRPARVRGWHRRFCLSTPVGRGTPDNPGLVLGLDEGGACTGAAFRIEDALVEEELSLLWRREMLAGSYIPRWLPVAAPRGRVFGHAIAFTINPTHRSYTGTLSPEQTIERLATARGTLGSAAEYLFRTVDGLRALEVRDVAVERLARQVAARMKRDA